MGDVKGRSLALAASAAGSSYTAVAGVKDVSKGGSAATIDVTDTDSGEDEEHLTGIRSHSWSIAANWDEADAGLAIIRTAFDSNAQVYLRYRPRGDLAGARESIALGTITKFDESSAFDGAAEVSIDFQITGTPTSATQ